MISRLRYTLREMWASLTRNLTLTVAAVITSMVSLFLFGMTLLIQQAFDNQLSQWTGGVKMIVYVKNGAEPDAVDRINKTGTTVMMATHDTRIVNMMRRRVIELDRGVIIRDQARGVYE